MKNKSMDKILADTDGGLKLYQLLLPHWQKNVSSYNQSIDSPISKGKKCFSIYQWKGKYLFKDFYSNQKGDIFELVAIMNNLSSKTDFPQVLKIIDSLMDASHAVIPETEKTWYDNHDNGDELCLAHPDYSKAMIVKYLMPSMPYLESKPLYTIQLVVSFDLKSQDKNNWHEFDYATPKDAFYSIEIKKDQYYILFNPVSRVVLEYGQKIEYHLLGMEHLFSTAYTYNIHLRDTIVITNKIEGLLWCQDKGIPAILLLNDELTLPDFFVDFILEKFRNRYLILELLGNSGEQRQSLSLNYLFENIITGEIYLPTFFKHGDKAIDKIFTHLEHSDGYEYEGHGNPVIKGRFEEEDN